MAPAKVDWDMGFTGHGWDSGRKSSQSRKRSGCSGAAPPAGGCEPARSLRLCEESGNPRDFEVILRHKSQGLLEVENPIVASQGPRAGGAHSTCKA